MKYNFLKSMSILFLGVVLTGCSTGSSDKSESKNDTQESTQEPAKIAFAKEAQSSKERIWYEVDENSDEQIAKDSSIDSIIITKNGKMKTYSWDSSLLDVSKMSDKEVLAKVKKDDKNRFAEEKKQSLKDTDYTIKDLKRDVEEYKNEDDHGDYGPDLQQLNDKIEDEKNNIEPIKDLSYQAPKWQKIKITAETDSSANNLENESFTLKQNGINVVTKEFGEEDSINDRDFAGETKVQQKFDEDYELTGTLQNYIQILKKYYTGYIMDDDNYLLTRTSQDTAVSLDKTTTKGIKVEDN